jgi:glycogen synthase
VKLLIYSHFFAPSIGGVETIVRSLASGLALLHSESKTPSFEVTVITETPANGSDAQCPPLRIVRKPGLVRLFRLIGACDVVHIAGPALLPMVIGLVLRKPVVVEHHGFQSICPNGQLLIEPTDQPCPGHFMKGNYRACLACTRGSGWLQSRKLWILTFVRRLLCQVVSANISPTAWLSGLLDLPRTETVPHGLEPRTTLTRPEPSEQPLIVFQGRLVTTKGVRVLLEAARLLEQQNLKFQLLIIGEGPARTLLEQIAHNSLPSEHVMFAGRLSTPDLETAITSASIVVIPSLGGEVFGLVVAENMQRGLPIVASDLGSFREVLGDAGLTFRTGDSADLASKLVQLIRDPSLRTSLALIGRQRCENLFGHTQMIDRHAYIYRTLTSKKISLN